MNKNQEADKKWMMEKYRRGHTGSSLHIIVMRNKAKQRNVWCVIAVLALCMLLTPDSVAKATEQSASSDVQSAAAEIPVQEALDYGSAEKKEKASGRIEDGRCICRRMDRRFGHDRTGYHDSGNTVCNSIFHLVPVHETLPGRGEKNE